MFKKIKALKTKMMDISIIPMDKDFFMNKYGKFLTLEDLTRIRIENNLDKKNIGLLLMIISMAYTAFIFFGLTSNDNFLCSLKITVLVFFFILLVCVLTLHNNEVQIRCCEKTIEILNKRENEIISKIKILKENIK